jgi:hypothetical protein
MISRGSSTFTLRREGAEALKYTIFQNEIHGLPYLLVNIVLIIFE